MSEKEQIQENTPFPITWEKRLTNSITPPPMANRVLSPKLLQNGRRSFIKRLNSSPSPSPITAASPLSLVEKPPITGAADPPNNSFIDLDDFSKIFASVSTAKLFRSSINLHVAALGPMVDVGMWVMRSRVMMESVLLRDVIKHTLFEHFCAGEDMDEVGRAVRRLWGSDGGGLKGMLNYGAEHTNDNESSDRNLERFLEAAESTNSLPPSSVSSIAVKITAICPMRVLERVSDLLRWEHKDPSFHLPWKLNTFPILSDSSPFYHTLKKPDPLTQEEEHDLQLGHQRLQKLCQKCLEINLPLLIDAEDTFIQPAIDYFIYSAAIIYNKDDNPIVFGTIQAYLKDARERLLLATKAAEKMGIPMGFKLVRGAYLSSETQLASSLGFESPIHKTIQETHNCYNDCASFMLEKIANGCGAVFLATHNVESGKLAAAKARDLGIRTDNQKLQFAQLYGMSEALSYGLRNAGFIVSKFMLFGPIEMVMPFLLRRAEENRGFLSSSTLDRVLMRKELKRRLKAAILSSEAYSRR